MRAPAVRSRGRRTRSESWRRPAGVDLRLGPRPCLGQPHGVHRRLADQLEQPVLLAHAPPGSAGRGGEPDRTTRGQLDRPGRRAAAGADPARASSSTVPPLCWIGATSVAAIQRRRATTGRGSMSRRGSRHQRDDGRRDHGGDDNPAGRLAPEFRVSARSASSSADQDDGDRDRPAGRAAARRPGCRRQRHRPRAAAARSGGTAPCRPRQHDGRVQPGHEQQRRACPASRPAAGSVRR